MKDFEIKATLQLLLSARGPCGQEDEVREAATPLLKNLVDDIWTDEAGNLIGLLRGGENSSGKDPIRLFAHLDEIGLIVKRVESDGRLRVNRLGGLYPADLGQGPVEILGDEKILPGVLSAWCAHTTAESSHRNKTTISPRGKGQCRDWADCFVFTGLTKDELEKAGVHAGTRVAVAQYRRDIWDVGDFWAAYFMDNRAAIAISLVALQELRNEGKRPRADTYVVLSTEEENGGQGACFAARTLPGNTSLAIDVGPVAEEYQTKLDERPIITYADGRATYTKSLCDEFLKTAEKASISTQCAIWESYGSDSSIAKSVGQSGRAALLCIPTQNTHGFEIVHKKGVEQCAKLIAQWLS